MPDRSREQIIFYISDKIMVKKLGMLWNEKSFIFTSRSGILMMFKFQRLFWKQVQTDRTNLDWNAQIRGPGKSKSSINTEFVQVPNNKKCAL